MLYWAFNPKQEGIICQKKKMNILCSLENWAFWWILFFTLESVLLFWGDSSRPSSAANS